MAHMASQKVQKLAADLFRSVDWDKARTEDLLTAYVEQPSKKHLPFDFFLAVWIDQRIDDGTLQPSAATRRILARIKTAAGYTPAS